MSTQPTLLLLGDSIRLSYEGHVSQLLEGRARVVGPPENCQYSLYTLSSLNRWLSTGRPDIVYWNNGLHDCGHNPDRSPVQIPLEMYLANLEIILRKLRVLASTVIWATTTPVHPDRPFRVSQWSWRNEEIEHYNQASRDLMEGKGIPVHDLHQVVWQDTDGLLCDDQLHLSSEGQMVCAQSVVDCVSRFLS
ncbi:MAG: hypothetical protein CMJ81_14010 [Planctomycetaceae bacterium]|nr:hypothetical protein [Planctomycetaceae bacterium]MBP61496.1 hypothetical protein [Planctomycetaceae bacterium]